MILPPPDSTMEKDIAARLHRGDTVRTNGPPSYNSAISASPIASSSSAPHPSSSRHLPAVPERRTSDRSQASSASLESPTRILSRSSSQAVLSLQPPPSHPSLSSRSYSHLDASPPAKRAATDPIPAQSSHLQSRSANYAMRSASTIGRTGAESSVPSSPSSIERERRASPDIIFPSDPHALLSAPIVNGIHVVQDDEISGSWRIDPDVPYATQPPKKTRRPKRLRKAMCEKPNLSLETKSGHIATQIAIIGRASYESRKAYVRVTSRCGKVNVDVREQTLGRYFDLDVYSRDGDSVLLIPRSFQGIIELHSKKGHVIVRPALAKAARTLRSSKEEMLLIVGSSSATENEHMDYVRFNSEGGASVAIGYTIEDDITVPPHGFWKKFGLMLQGKGTRVVEKTATPDPI